jgi:DNA-binding GntR family transcriptional regulator
MGEQLNLKLKDRDTLYLKVCSVLRKAILRGDFIPGERLLQADLATALGVSRIPVREALLKLEAEGLIEFEPHRGAVVKALDVEDIKEIYELRSLLEKIAVEQSIGHLKEEEIVELERYVSQMEEAKGVDVFVEANIKFHRLLIKNCPWSRLLSFIETLWNGFPQQTPHLLTDQMDISNQEHQDILEAVKEKNERKAAKLVYEHIKRTGNTLVKSKWETDSKM